MRTPHGWTLGSFNNDNSGPHPALHKAIDAPAGSAQARPLFSSPPAWLEVQEFISNIVLPGLYNIVWTYNANQDPVADGAMWLGGAMTCDLIVPYKDLASGSALGPAAMSEVQSLTEADLPVGVFMAYAWDSEAAPGTYLDVVCNIYRLLAPA